MPAIKWEEEEYVEDYNDNFNLMCVGCSNVL